MIDIVHGIHGKKLSSHEGTKARRENLEVESEAQSLGLKSKSKKAFGLRLKHQKQRFSLGFNHENFGFVCGFSAFRGQ